MKYKLSKNTILILSLLVNALFVGHFMSFLLIPVGMFSFHRMPPPSRMMPLPFASMENAIDRLDPENRDKVRSLMHEHKAVTETHMDNMGKNFEVMFAMFMAEKFDADAIMEAEEKLSGEDMKVKSSLLSFMINVATALPDEQRIEFFKHALPPKMLMRRPLDHEQDGDRDMGVSEHDYMPPPDIR